MPSALPPITVIAVGKNKDRALMSLITSYFERLPTKIQMIEIDPPRCSDDERKSREAALIRAHFPSRAVVFLLDERGKDLNSVAFADLLQHVAQHDTGARAVFVIGGADGLDPTLRAEAAHILAFGSATWPHMLVRLLLAEQIYRAHTILANHPYHRV